MAKRSKKSSATSLPVKPAAASTDEAAVLAKGKDKLPTGVMQPDVVEPKPAVVAPTAVELKPEPKPMPDKAEADKAAFRARSARLKAESEIVYEVAPGSWLSRQLRTETITHRDLERCGRNIRALIKHGIVRKKAGQ